MNPDRIRAWLGENRIRAAAVFLAALLLLLLLIGLLLVNVWIGRIRYERDDEDTVTIDRAYAAGNGIYFPDIEPVRQPGVINVLFLGTDFAVGAEGNRGRADSNMLCSLDTRSGAIRLVSFERGIGVPVPGRGSDLLTHAYHWGGSELSQSIIAQMFAVTVDGYAQVDFSGFADVIDAIGGVDVELTEMEAKALNGAIATNVWAWVEVHEGMNHLCGHDALEYCRLRSIDSDWNRQMRQRKVLEQIQKSCRKMSPLQLVKLAGLTPEKASRVAAPLIAESPVNIECRVTEIRDLGSHTMFLAEVLAVHVDDRYMDENGKFDLSLARPIVYSHGEYLTTGKKLGTFGYSVRKKKRVMKGRRRA